MAEIAGSYISSGNEAHNLRAVEAGLQLLNDNSEILKEAVTESSIDYCLGNGYSALYKISIANNREHFPKPDAVKDYLFTAKQSYLKAFKTIDLNNLDSFSIQILTNLGNNLNQSGRMVEALQLFDMVLKFNPEFPEAFISKADALVYLQSAANFPITISLYVTIHSLFKKANENPIAAELVKQRVEEGLKKSEHLLQLHNFDFGELPRELELNEEEYENHNFRTKFYLDNFISLSEHGLYCYCNGAKIDDLMIGFSGFTTSNKRVLQFEVLLNRLKSEFSLSRYLYFDYIMNSTEDNIHYENLSIDIINGLNHEKLRTSFRLCFGILDKIAEGLCEVLNLERKARENIYFESFWSSRGGPKDRWEKINSFYNIHLTALYSIACDLNAKNGEFGFYKTWRNRLEHGIFSLTESNSPNLDLLTDSQFSEHTQEIFFEDKTKHLIQLTRSALFSFVFLVRQELMLST